MSIASGTAEFRGDRTTVRFAEIEYSTRGFGGLAAHLHDAAQEENEPLLPRPGIAYGLQSVVILLPMLFEEMRQVKNRL